MELVALKLTVNFRSGKRAGGRINTRGGGDRGVLVTDTSWQNPADQTEIRLVVDGNVSEYEGIDGVTVIRGAEAIDAAIQESLGDKADPSARRYIYEILDSGCVGEGIVQSGIDVTQFGARRVIRRWFGLVRDVLEPGAEKPPAQQLWELGCFGTRRVEIVPPTAQELYNQAMEDRIGGR